MILSVTEPLTDGLSLKIFKKVQLTLLGSLESMPINYFSFHSASINLLSRIAYMVRNSYLIPYVAESQLLSTEFSANYLCENFFVVYMKMEYSCFNHIEENILFRINFYLLRPYFR